MIELGQLYILIRYILIDFAIFMIVTLSLNFEVGVAGIAQFGRVLAVEIGAYVAGGLTGRILAYTIPELRQYSGAEYSNHLINFKLVDTINRTLLEHNALLSIGILILTLALAAIIGGIVGWLTSYPAIRLKEAYLGITLLAFGDVVMLIAQNYDPIVGATQGVSVPDPFRWARPYSFEAALIIALILAGLTFIFFEMLVRSPFGRALKAMRDDEVAAKVYGKDIVKLRTYALIIGSAFAAMAGAYYTMYIGSCKAFTYTRLTWTFWPWAFMMLGGTGNNVGIAVGVLIFVIVRTIIINYKTYLEPFVPFDPIWLEPMFVGVVIILLSVFRPQGLIPEKPAFTIKKRRIRSIIEIMRKQAS